MCGIFTLLNTNNHKNFSKKQIEDAFEKGKHRGPEFSTIKYQDNNTIFGFHRLAINGLNPEANQPIIIDGISLICNGEIYNYQELYDLMDVTPNTDSDCEVIIHLYKRYGIEQTLQMLDGVFSFVLYENDHVNCDVIYIARDPYGVRPLYQIHVTNGFNTKEMFGFASELKMLNDFVKSDEYNYKIFHFEPGSYSKLCQDSNTKKWSLDKNQVKYHGNGFHSVMYSNDTDYFTMRYIIQNIQFYFISAVMKRATITDRPVACLLSGGLDSSLVTALVCEVLKDQQVETYSIGLEGSEDLKYARIVADYLGTKHTEIVLTEQEFCDAIPEVIENIESYDTTTVRASIGNYLVAKYISEHSEAKVIFNGDGSDELMGGYLYMNYINDSIEFDKETRRLLKDIHMYDVLRSDKSISSNGLEPRTPFLDRSFVEYYLSIPANIRFHKFYGQPEKSLIRNTFSKDNFQNHKGLALLPDEILWRRKEAFSDGVSNQSRSLYTILQEFAEKQDVKMELYDIKENYPDTKEKMYYRTIFEQYYPKMGHLVPYFWMPRYVTNATDASARTLDIYQNNHVETDNNVWQSNNAW